MSSLSLYAGWCAMVGVGCMALKAFVNHSVIPSVIFQPPNQPTSEYLQQSQRVAPGFQTVRMGLVFRSGRGQSDRILPSTPPSPPPPPLPLSKCVIFLHGNACTAAQSSFLFELLHVFDSHDVYIPEYCGYADLSLLSSPSYQETCDALDEFFASTILSRYDHIDIVGQSLGTHFATRMVSRFHTCPQMQRLILISPFCSLPSLVASHVGWLAEYPLIFVSDFYTETFAKQLPSHIKVIIFHGDKDTLIPFQESERLEKVMHHVHDKRIIRLGHIGHNDIPWNIVNRFIG